MVHESMTAEELFKKCTELFTTWKDLDLTQITSERNPQAGSYSIWVKDNIEADEDMTNKSADDIKEARIITETLEERFLHGLKYFKETGKHLDEVSLTLCAGSRRSNDFVPGVDWIPDNNKMRVQWYGSNLRSNDLRARVAIS